MKRFVLWVAILAFLPGELGAAPFWARRPTSVSPAAKGTSSSTKVVTGTISQQDAKVLQEQTASLVKALSQGSKDPKAVFTQTIALKAVQTGGAKKKP